MALRSRRRRPNIKATTRCGDLATMMSSLEPDNPTKRALYTSIGQRLGELCEEVSVVLGIIKGTDGTDGFAARIAILEANTTRTLELLSMLNNNVSKTQPMKPVKKHDNPLDVPPVMWWLIDGVVKSVSIGLILFLLTNLFPNIIGHLYGGK